MTSVSRRTFLGTAAAASVSAVAAPAMAASTSGNNLPAKWDDTVDVVVLGCGGAGMMAACQAHDAGGKVAVYDAGQSPFHTATNLCGGLFTAWGSKMQNADPEGRKDSWQQVCRRHHGLRQLHELEGTGLLLRKELRQSI